MDQAGQPHAVEWRRSWQSVSSPPSWPGLSSLLHANRLQGQVAHLTEQLLAADQAKQTAQAEAAAQPAQLAASESHDEALQARIDELEELLHAPWHQALLAYARKHGEPTPKARTQRASLYMAAHLGLWLLAKLSPRVLLHGACVCCCYSDGYC